MSDGRTPEDTYTISSPCEPDSLTRHNENIRKNLYLFIYLFIFFLFFIYFFFLAQIVGTR